MHKRVDLTLIWCAFGFHDAVRVAEHNVYGRTVIYRRCVRCSRHLPARGSAVHTPAPEAPKVRSRYT